MLDFQAVGEKIHNLRVDKGYSQDEMAELLFVSRQAISRWELGLTLPSVDNLAELCKMFGVTFEELLCLGQPVSFEEDDIFKGHSRNFVVQSIITGKLQVNLPNVFYRFSPSERTVLLKAVKEKKIATDINELSVKLTESEKLYLFGGGKSVTDIKLSGGN